MGDVGPFFGGVGPNPLLDGNNGDPTQNGAETGDKDHNLNSYGWDTGLGYGGYAYGNEDLGAKTQGLWQQYANRGVDAANVDPRFAAQQQASDANQAASRQAQMGAMGSMMAQAQGGDTAALEQARQTAAYGQSAQNAMQANAGSPQALAAARSQAAQSGATQQSMMGNQMNALKAQEQQTGLQQYQDMANQVRGADQDVYGTNQQMSAQQAQLEMQRRQANDQMTLGYSGLQNSLTTAQNQIALGQGANNLSLQAQNFANDSKGYNAALGGVSGFGTGVAQAFNANGGGGGGDGNYQDSYDGTIYQQDPYSDEDLKKNIEPHGLMHAFLDALAKSRASYNYKEPRDEPRSTPTGGKYMGVMAQDVEAVPEIGHQLISDTPHGKRIEGAAMLSALAAGMGDIHERVRHLEGYR